MHGLVYAGITLQGNNEIAVSLCHASLAVYGLALLCWFPIAHPSFWFQVGRVARAIPFVEDSLSTI